MGESVGRGLRRGALAIMLAAAPAAGQERYAVIPHPVVLEPGTGELVLGSGTGITVDPAAAGLAPVAERWASDIRRATGLPLTVATGSRAAGGIHLRIDSAGIDGREAYGLEVTPDGATIVGGGAPGVFYGLQTLRQLLPAQVGSETIVQGVSWTVPAVRIEDRPRFRYRGMHLDVARHFFTVDEVKSYLDYLASYKFNTFHWHLTEDQGWRIEIERYPLLTEIGAWRKETVVRKNFDPYIGDGIPYGGFYTQDEVREVVAYAAERFITVIPEIEMPGHSTAALAAYSGLACTEGPFEVVTRWGVFEDIYCPKEETFTFLENVLTEVMALFPSEYIHIGGDEAPKTRWRESEIAQNIIRREGLKDEAELQSWFIRRIEQFLREHGRRIIGWDEILEGGLPPEATVMSWRGMEGGIAAAKEGHDVIMTPTSHVYFDYYQGPPESEPFGIGGLTPLRKVYDFEPVPPDLSLAEARHVIGAQGNLWTEYIKTFDHVQYMIFPRMIALSEVVWSPREERDWESFIARLPTHLERLDVMGVRYRPLDPAK